MAADENDENAQTTQWLGIASGLDYTARILIRYCLTVAAQNAVDKSRDWVALSEAIAKEDDIDIKIVRFVTTDSAALNSENQDDQGKAEIEELLKRLEGFTQFASVVSAHLRKQLGRPTP